MSTIGNIKTQIKTVLDALAPTYLKSVTLSDIRKDPLDAEIGAYPAAFIMPPSLGASDRLDNRDVLRDYTFFILVVMRAEDLSTTADVEDLMERVVNALDDSITLDGNAVGGIVPVTSAPEAYQHNGRDLIVFDVIIKARALQMLNF
jgi:hypothetical protein